MSNFYDSDEDDRPEWFYAAIVAAIVAGSAGVLAITIPYGWPWYAIVGSFSVAIGSTWGSVQLKHHVAKRAGLISYLVAGAVVALLSVGAVTQLVLDGRPVLETSSDAQAHTIVYDLYQDIMKMGKYDELLVIEQPDARARYNDYEPAARELRKVANRWARIDLGNLPDPDLIEIVQHIKAGATAGAAAVDLRYQIITEPDARAETIMNEERGAYLAETVAAGAKLRPLADKYGVDIDNGGGLE